MEGRIRLATLPARRALQLGEASPSNGGRGERLTSVCHAGLWRRSFSEDGSLGEGGTSGIFLTTATRRGEDKERSI